MYQKYAELRDERNLTDYKVAKDTGIAQQTLSAWKLEGTTPKIDKIIVLCDYFGISIDDFVKP